MRIFLSVVAVLLFLIALFFIAVRYPAFQTWLAHRATDIISRTLDTKVSIERVEIQFFNKADFVNFYVEDRHQDTLLSAKEFTITFKIFKLFDRRIEVSKIFLDEGGIYLHGDSSGTKTNLSELISRFKSVDTTKVDTVKTPFTWHIDLREAELLNTRFRYFDEKAKSDLKVSIPLCKIDLNKLSVDKKLIDIASAKLDGIKVGVDLMKRVKTANTDTTGVLHFMPDGMLLKFGEIAVTNTSFRLDDHNNDTAAASGMDFRHLNVYHINLEVAEGKIIADTIFASVKNLSAVEHSGFELKELSTIATVSVNEIKLDRLFLKTPHSEIKNYLSFKYKSTNDFKDFMNRVNMKVNFAQSVFTLKDLSYFVGGLDRIAHNRLSINGTFEGKASDLRGKNIEIKTGRNTVLRGNFFTRGLPDIYETSLNLRINRMATTMSDIKLFYPQIKIPDNLNNLGLIYYTGSLDGFITDFVSKGKFVTDLGEAVTDVNFKYDKKHNKAYYQGDLAMNEFDLGKFFNAGNNIGKVSLQTKISGGGLTLESLNAELKGNISSIQLLGYDYRNVNVDGAVLKKSFNGSLNIHDANLDMVFNGKADFTDSIPKLNFDANVKKALLKNLNLVKDDYRVAGRISSDFRGANVDDIVGKIQLNDVTVARDTVEELVKYFTLDAKLLSSQKKEIKINSEFMEAEMEGNFTIKELPAALASFARHTFTKDYRDSVPLTSEQNFTADVRIFEPGNITRIIHPNFTLIRNSRISGDFSSVNNKVNLTATIPEIEFSGYNAKRTDIKAHFENGNIDFLTLVDKVYANDSLWLDTLNIASKTQQNEDIRFDVSLADKNRFNYANVTAFLTPLKDKAVLKLEPCDIKLGNNYWNFNKGNSIFFEGRKITTNNLIFKSQDQTVYVTGYLKNDTSTSFKFTLDNTDIGDFTGIFATKMKDLHGTINGKLVVEDIFYKPNVYADLVVNEFTLGTELIGDINVDSRLDETGKNVELYASVKSVNNLIEARGNISFQGATPSMKIDVDAQKLGLNFLNYRFFTEKYVKNCRGYAVAKATIAGPLSKPLLTGEVLLVNDTVTVSFLNTTYRLDHQKAYMDAHGFYFPEITIYDERNNVLWGKGRINHESFRQFALDLKVETPNGQFLNTTVKQSPNFYGVAYGQGSVTFYGDINSPTIKAYARTLSGTHCRLPVNSSYETSRYGFYKFVSPNEKKVSTVVQSPQLKLNGVHFILELEATPEARMDIILDPVAGDMLTTYGRGNLKIEIPTVGNTTMYGNYEIDRGDYLFTLQNVVNKRLEIIPGGVINFNGDVYKAGLNVNASYEVRSSLTDLIYDLIYNLPNYDQLASAARSRITVKLLMNLTGVLERPNIAFDFSIADPDPVIKSYVEQKQSILKNNENEMNKQVFSLIVMNRFFPTEVNTALTNYVGGTATNTVSEFLSSQLSNYLSNLLDYSGNSALQNLDINIGYRQYSQSSLNNSTNNSNNNTTTSSDTRRELQLALQQRLLNNRLTISAGGNFDFGNTVDSTGTNAIARSNVIPTGDFQLQYALTPDARWRVKAFNRTNYDYFNSRNNNRTGIGISYNQEFDKPAELFHKKKKRDNKNDKK